MGFEAYETLFHYYLWPWLHLFGHNILTNEAASLALWCATFLFTLLLTDLFFESYIVTSVIALVFTFLPFAFIYSFFAFHYEMAVPLCVASLYFLHVGFKTDSSFCLALGGIAAGLCLASSLLGQQYVLALLVFVVLCAVFDRKCLKQISIGAGSLQSFMASLPEPCLFWLILFLIGMSMLSINRPIWIVSGQR